MIHQPLESAFEEAADAESLYGSKPSVGHRILHSVSFQNIGAVYVLVVIVIYFCVTSSEFRTLTTFKEVLDTNSITAIAALGLVLPLSTGVFDLSFAYTMSLTGVTSTYFIVTGGMPVWLAVLLSLLIAIGIGLGNGFVIVGLRIDSFIGTLATGSIITALATAITHDSEISGPQLQGAFSRIAGGAWRGFTLPIVYMLLLALIIWHVQERTATGRRMYAVGFNRETARLAGVKADRLRFASLVVSAFVAGVAGIVLASSVESGSSSGGTPYLLTAFAAAFVGATQLKRGRFNAWGTIIAVLLLGTGIVGLADAGGALWSQSLFTGVVLIAALAITSYERGAWGTLRSRFRFLQMTESNRPVDLEGSDL